LICLLLSGCGAADPQPTIAATIPTTTPYDPEENGPTPAPETHGPLPLVEIGEFCDVPGGIITLDDLKDIEVLQIDVIDDLGFMNTYAWEYSFALGRFIFYISEEGNNDAILYVKKGDNIDSYEGSYGDTLLYQNPYADQIGYDDDLSFLGSVAEILVSYSVPKENTRYKRVEDMNAPTGEAYVYEIYTGDQHTGYLLIDKATGLAVSQTDSNKVANYKVIKLSTKDIAFPEYK
jgi:hypothetical protein